MPLPLCIWHAAAAHRWIADLAKTIPVGTGFGQRRWRGVATGSLSSLDTSFDVGRRRLRRFAFFIAAAFGVLAFSIWWSGRVETREGSKVVSEQGSALRITKIPKTYRAVFTVESYADDEQTITTERVWVRRPFESRVETRRGKPPGTAQLSLRQSAFGVLASIAPDARPLNIAAPPSVGSSDLRIDAALKEALDNKTIELRERREVYGRECQVYRAGGPVLAGDLDKYRAGAKEFADVCVDRNGIVIEEFWMSDDKLLRRRAAVELEIDPKPDDDLFDIEAPAEEGPTRGTVQPVPRDAVDPGEIWRLRSAPDGFDFLGKFAVIRSTASVPQQGGGVAGASPPTSTSDVYVRGPDLIVVDQDPSLIGAIRSEDRPSRKIELDGFETAEMIVDARMSEVRGETEDDSVVRIYGTVPPDELLELAKDLRRPTN
jgi:hypothetical protein